MALLSLKLKAFIACPQLFTMVLSGAQVKSELEVTSVQTEKIMEVDGRG